jgi:hypothetical protein
MLEDVTPAFDLCRDLLSASRVAWAIAISKIFAAQVAAIR